MKIGVFRDVADFLREGKARGGTAAGAGRELCLFTQPDLSSVGTTGMVWPPNARHRNQFSAEKRNPLIRLLLEFLWRQEVSPN